MEKYNDSEKEIEIDLQEILYVLWRRLWMIILAAVIGGGLTTAYCRVILMPKYTSTSMVYILSKETTLTSLADLQIGSQLTKDYKVVVTSRPVLQEVIDTLGLSQDYEELKGALVLANPADTRMLRISIEDSDPARAKEIVNTVARVSSKYIGDIMEMTPPKIIEEGIVPTRKSSPRVTRNAMLGAGVAGILVCFLLVLQVILNDTIRNEEDVEKYLQLSVLAAIPEREDKGTTGRLKRGIKRKQTKQNSRNSGRDKQ